jgi:hypothetical protein
VLSSSPLLLLLVDAANATSYPACGSGGGCGPSITKRRTGWGEGSGGGSRATSKERRYNERRM